MLNTPVSDLHALGSVQCASEEDHRKHPQSVRYALFRAQHFHLKLGLKMALPPSRFWPMAHACKCSTPWMRLSLIKSPLPLSYSSHQRAVWQQFLQSTTDAQPQST